MSNELSCGARRTRRTLTGPELTALVDAATKGPEVKGIPGIERAVAYYLAATTGLRAAELAGLTRESFVFSEEPHVVVEPACSAHRRRDVVPLRADVAQRVREYLAAVKRDEKLFRRCAPRPGLPLSIDLEAAGIPRTTSAGVVDFRSLRATFLSNLFSPADRAAR